MCYTRIIRQQCELSKQEQAPTLRHIRRLHKVCVAWLHERVKSDDIDLKDCATDAMAASLFTKQFINGDKWLQVSQLIGVVSKSVVKKLGAAALTLMPPCAAAVRCHPHRHMHVCAVACLPSRNVTVFEKGNEIGESVYLESFCNIERSDTFGPSAAPPAPHADVAEEASRMTSWASWVHAALRCLCS